MVETREIRRAVKEKRRLPASSKTSRHSDAAWQSNGRRDCAAKSYEGAENIWIAILGPDAPALGERADTEPVFQSRIVATLASLLGEDYHAAVPKAGKPIKEALPK